MSYWEYLWIVIKRDPKSNHWGADYGDWYVETTENEKIIGLVNVTGYLNKLGSEGWEQVSSTGEHIGELTRMKSIHIFFKRPTS